MHQYLGSYETLSKVESFARAVLPKVSTVKTKSNFCILISLCALGSHKLA
ncbi:Uncharacterised protein [Vibrio cholerae]|nr:Uncharacterised protein [Vibrio cholerae]